MAAPGLSRKVCSPLGPLCEGAPPAGGGGENCTAVRNISGYGKVLSLRPFGAPPSQREVFDMQKGCRECGIPFCVLKECIVGASIARPCPFVLQENCPGKCGAQFSVTVMVPILVLSAVVLPNAPLRESAAVPLGASSTAVPTALARLSDALSKVPLMPSKPEAAA